MKQNEIIEQLEKLYFTKLEAKIYLTLVEHGELSGYQIAKQIDMTRPSVYNTLLHMYEKGMVLQSVENKTNYLAQNPKVLLQKLRYEYEKNVKNVMDSIDVYLEGGKEERLLSFQGFETVMFKAKEWLSKAKKEAYLNMDFPIQLLKKELHEALEKGVRIILFSFYELDMEGLPIEFYTHGRKLKTSMGGTRFMMVVDGAEVLIANGNKERGTWNGHVTNNELMISIVSEHIHNDIYLLRLRDRYGSQIYEENYLGTEFEKGK